MDNERIVKTTFASSLLGLTALVSNGSLVNDAAVFGLAGLTSSLVREFSIRAGVDPRFKQIACPVASSICMNIMINNGYFAEPGIMQGIGNYAQIAILGIAVGLTELYQDDLYERFE
jgi:hypothetical protein